ncbi:hypothetical protein NDU88_001467 [Pleurodeles waltl]|uniref:Uncharacterized protein n=1 Tax=Pleurodeles waltl TaxID=8319 RepID=A0AAV7RBQ4_PLEWA|nr:hypothetical protein NDU88_001467 [Pleurodeles waltl]
MAVGGSRTGPAAGDSGGPGLRAPEEAVSGARGNYGAAGVRVEERGLRPVAGGDSGPHRLRRRRGATAVETRQDGQPAARRRGVGGKAVFWGHNQRPCAMEEVAMASSKPKRDQSVREMLTRSHPAQTHQAEAAASTRGADQLGNMEVEGEAPVKKSFLTSLFDSLRVDLQELRRDISQEVRELRSDITSLGGRVSNIEDNVVSRAEEVEQLQQEVLRLHEQQEQLQLMAEDLENRSPRHNIRIRGPRETISESLLQPCLAPSCLSFWIRFTE